MSPTPERLAFSYFFLLALLFFLTCRNDMHTYIHISALHAGSVCCTASAFTEWQGWWLDHVERLVEGVGKISVGLLTRRGICVGISIFFLLVFLDSRCPDLHLASMAVTLDCEKWTDLFVHIVLSFPYYLTI